ncbi:MAG TPA: glycosyltransferase 61 family protein [Nocardioidaceae bacterium]
MSRNTMPVDELLSWARREGPAIQVGLRLPGADLAPGKTTVRLTRRKGELQVDADATGESDAVTLAFTVPRTTLAPPAWRIAVQTGADGRFQPVEARLLAPKDQPVAVLPGPPPDTKMPAPSPRRPGRAMRTPVATPTRRVLRRGRSLARAARRAARKLTAGRGSDRSADRPGRRPGTQPDRPALRLDGPALRAVRAAGKHPVVVLADASTEHAVSAWLPALRGTDVTMFRIGADSPRAATAADVVDVADTADVADAADAADVVDANDVDDVERRLFPTEAPAALVVALSPATLRSLATDHVQLLVRLFPHLRHGGAYVAYAVPTGGPSASARDHAIATFRRALEESAGDLTAGSPGGRKPRMRGIRDVVVRPGFVLLRKNRRDALHVREEQVADLLPAREPGTEVSILEVRPSGSLQVTATEISYGPRQAEPWPKRLDYPELTLRHYRGDLMSMGSMLLTAESTILPESFRWPHRSKLGQASVRSAGPHFSTVPRVKGAPILEGDYYFLDCLFSGHFGHLLTEVVCRLWGWEAARRELPNVKALFHTNPRRGRHGALERKLFAAYGVPEADLVSTDRPVRLRSVVGASPMWHNAPPFYVHPDIQETWARLTSGLLDGRPPAEHERIFVSRGDDLNRRRCRNQPEVERFFADRGFHVFYPERLPLEEQVALFAGARVVAGFGGSAMFNMLHCRRLEKTIVISHNSYEARNENLFMSVLGGELHYFWQESDVSLTGGATNRQKRRSSYAFDFENYGTDLARVISQP